jgi:anti-anti-sigma factor
MVVRAVGVLDFVTCPVLMAFLEVTDDRHDRRVAVDVSGVEFCDSSGLRCLLMASRRLRNKGREFLLLHPSPPLRWRMMTTGADGLLPAADELPGSGAR